MKWPWERNGVVGRIKVSGRRRDGDAPPPRIELADGGGEHGFSPSALVFPTPGCWEVSAHAASATLTFVTRVIHLEEENTGTR